MQPSDSPVPLHRLANHARSRAATRPMVQELRAAFQTVAYQTDELHRHDYFEVYVFEKGEGVCVADHESHSVRGGAIFILPPGAMHYWKDSKSLHGFIIRIPLIEGNSLFGNAASRPGTLSIENQALPHVLSLLAWMAADSPTREFQRTPLSRQRWRLLYECLSDEAQKNGDTYPVFGPSDICASFSALLERKFHLRWGVQDYANALNISRSSLLRATQLNFDCSPAELVRLRTLKEAERYLLTTEYSCAEISELLGFLTQAQFNKAFANKFNETPTAFRQSRIGNESQ